METAALPAAACAVLQHEHMALLRYLGRLQQELGAQLTRLETENLRLRAALLVTRTAWLWGLAPRTAASVAQQGGRRAMRTVAALTAAGVNEVMCQVACEGHAHYWLGEDGQCQRSGEACEHLLPGADRR